MMEFENTWGSKGIRYTMSKVVETKVNIKDYKKNKKQSDGIICCAVNSQNTGDKYRRDMHQNKKWRNDRNNKDNCWKAMLRRRNNHRKRRRKESATWWRSRSEERTIPGVDPPVPPLRLLLSAVLPSLLHWLISCSISISAVATALMLSEIKFDFVAVNLVVVGSSRLNKKQSKFDARCCTCWDPHETDDHLIQCPKRNNYRNRIYSEIENLRPILDPVLHDILNDGVRQHVGKKKHTIYDEHGSGNKGD